MKPIEDIIELRRQLHNHPDVSGCEVYAHNVIVDFLQALHPDELTANVGGYGVVALWKSKISTFNSQLSTPKTIAFRADIDALPIGHRCGHDGHTAIMLRFAEIVSQSELKYNVVLIFQPEEETGKGARKIVDSGLLQKYGVCAVFGLHNLPGVAEGTVLLNAGTFAAASMGVIYKLIGRSTHASTPEKGLNPGRAAATIIERIDGLNNNADSAQNNILTFKQTTLICCRVGEEAFGTSAGIGEVMFTLRAFTNDSMLELVSAADRIAKQEADRWHLELERQEREPFRATENTPSLVEQLKTVFSPQIKVETTLQPMRWSEDFAEYLHSFPGAFFGLGSGVKQPELHNPAYVFPDSLIEKGARCFELIMKNIKI